jgi:hypothetical protein
LECSELVVRDVLRRLYASFLLRRMVPCTKRCGSICLFPLFTAFDVSHCMGPARVRSRIVRSCSPLTTPRTRLFCTTSPRFDDYPYLKWIIRGVSKLFAWRSPVADGADGLRPSFRGPRELTDRMSDKHCAAQCRLICPALCRDSTWYAAMVG